VFRSFLIWNDVVVVVDRWAPSLMNKCESFCFDFFILCRTLVCFILYRYCKRTKRKVLLQSIVCMKTKHKSVTILVERERERENFVFILN